MLLLFSRWKQTIVIVYFSSLQRRIYQAVMLNIIYFIFIFIFYLDHWLATVICFYKVGWFFD